MLLKTIIILLLIVIIYCLGSGLFFLLREGVDSRKMVKALTWRIALSIGLFVLVLVAHLFGWINPHGVILAPPPPQ